MLAAVDTAKGADSFRSHIKKQIAPDKSRAKGIGQFMARVNPV
jgi:hypothetical protein